MMLAQKREGGFTILELLIAAAILGILLSLLGSLFVGSRRAYEVNEEVAAETQTLQSAVEVLKYDIGLAGYRGVDLAPGAVSSGRPFGGRPLTVADGASGGPDSVTVRFWEDRFVAGTPELRTILFTVSDGSLVRRSSGTDEAIIDGVVDFQVSSWLNRAATEFVVPETFAGVNRPPDHELAGIGLTLTLEGRSEPLHLTVALPNPQCENYPCN